MNIDWLRSSLIAGMIAVAVLIIFRWSDFQDRQYDDKQHHSEQIVRNQHSSLSDIRSEPPIAVSEQIDEFDLPAPPTKHTQNTEISNAPATEQDQLIKVNTDNFDILIDPVGGDLIQLSLVQHHVKLNQPDKPYPLLRSTTSHTYIARSGLAGDGGIDGQSGKGRPQFSSPSSHYSLKDGQNSLVVNLTFNQAETSVIKRFTFHRNSYLIDVDYIVTNHSDQTKQVSFLGSIKRDASNPNRSAGIGMAPFLGAATTMNETNYEKFDFGDIADKTRKHSITGGWVAMVQHYFLTAWIAPKGSDNSFTIKKDNNQDTYYLNFASAYEAITPGQQRTLSSQFYAGPKDVRKLEKMAPFLDLTVDYGWLWWIAKPLFFALDFIQGYVINWGIAIIVLTMLIKLMFFYPSAMSYRSMAKMRKVQPKMQEIKERCGDDRQRLSSEMMKLYRTEKINPVSGCLPILIQMPVFIALYWVLMESVELRHAPFFLWIEDLSVKDPYFVLPIIMGVTMWIQQKLNPQNPDPTMAKMMQIMPIFFTVLFLFFPAGLVLYWVANNSLSILQQYIITKQIERS